MKASAPRSYFGTLKELRLYFFLYHSSKHRWLEPLLSWCRVFCVILRQAQTYILQNDGVYFVRVRIFIMTRKVTGHYTAISLVNLGRTSSFCIVAYVVCSGSKLLCLLCSSSPRCGCCQDEGCVALEVRRGFGPSGVKRKVAWDNSKDVQGYGHLIAACKCNLWVAACEAVSVWCIILKEEVPSSYEFVFSLFW